MTMGEVIGAAIGVIALIGAFIWRWHLLALQVERVETKVEDLWDILLEDSRIRRSDVRGSPRLNDKGKELIPDDIKQAVAYYRKECHNGCDITGHDMVSMIKKALGLERLAADARERGISVLEYVALIADYYDD